MVGRKSLTSLPFCRASVPFWITVAVLQGLIGAGLSGCGVSGSAADSSGGRSVSEGANRLEPLPPAGSAGFTDVTRPAGILARHRLPTDDLDNIVDAVGSGAAFTDLDADGWLDLIVLGGPASPGGSAGDDSHAGIRVYRNRQDGTFEDVTPGCGIRPDTTAVAVTVADVDADGDRDIYLVDRGPNRLYRNRGGFVFEDATAEAGVGDPRFGVGAVFFDFDRDGDLDLYVTNYLEFDPRETAYYAPEGYPGPLAYPAQADVLYANRGDGTFEDVTAAAGVHALAARGMSLAAHDFDEDGDTDLFVANDATANFLLVNEGNGTFSEAGLVSGVAMGENGEQTAAMAADVGDVNGDGHLDLTVSDTGYGAVYLFVRPGLFVDEVMRSGVGMLSGQYVSWGQNLFDYDNDGDLDLFVANGGLHHLVGWQDLLLRNDGAGRFEDGADDGGPYFGSHRVSRSSIVGDYDNDGDLDLFVTTLADEHVLLRNDLSDRASWISLELVGDTTPDVFGARVRVEAGGKVWTSVSRCTTTYLGQSDVRLHFGLGPVSRVDRIEIVWPDGARRDLTDVPPNRILRIEESTR